MKYLGKYARSHFRIDLTGVRHAYPKYCALETACLAGIIWMEQQGMIADAVNLRHWMVMPSGFTRPHTPYWVILTVKEWELLSVALRQGGEPTYEYDLARTNGRWENSDGQDVG